MDYLIFFLVQRIDGKFVTSFDACSAGDTPGRVIPGLGHTNNTEITHSRLDTVIGTAVSKGTDTISNAGAHISCSRCRIPDSGFFLIDTRIFYNRLQFFIDLIHIFAGNCFDLKTLARCELHLPVSAGFPHLEAFSHLIFKNFVGDLSCLADSQIHKVGIDSAHRDRRFPVFWDGDFKKLYRTHFSAISHVKGVFCCGMFDNLPESLSQ